MNIAIIGSENVGGALAGSATRAGHSVTIGSADRSGANEVAGATGARVAGSNREAVESAEIAILALPADAIPEVASELREALAGKIVIDVVNRPTPDPGRPECTSHAEELQAMLPDALVVKAFNTLFASRQAEPALGGDTADAYVAADDAEAKRTVLELVESMGSSQSTPADWSSRRPSKGWPGCTARSRCRTVGRGRARGSSWGRRAHDGATARPLADAHV